MPCCSCSTSSNNSNDDENNIINDIKNSRSCISKNNKSNSNSRNNNQQQQQQQMQQQRQQRQQQQQQSTKWEVWLLFCFSLLCGFFLHLGLRWILMMMVLWADPPTQVEPHNRPWAGSIKITDLSISISRFYKFSGWVFLYFPNEGCLNVFISHARNFLKNKILEN